MLSFHSRNWRHLSCPVLLLAIKLPLRKRFTKNYLHFGVKYLLLLLPRVFASQAILSLQAAGFSPVDGIRESKLQLKEVFWGTEKPALLKPPSIHFLSDETQVTKENHVVFVFRAPITLFWVHFRIYLDNSCVRFASWNVSSKQYGEIRPWRK